MPTITGYHHVSLTVTDAARTEKFYSQTLGFDRVLGLPDEGGRGEKIIMLHPDTLTVLGFTVHQANDGTAFSEFRTGLDHLSFGVKDRGELDAWAARLDELGVEHSPVTTTSVGHLIAFRDPDNIQIELWANA